MSTKLNIDIITSINTDNVKSEVSKIQKSLSQVNFPESIGKNFDKILKDLEKELDNFEVKKEKALIDQKGFSAVEKSGEKITQLYKQLVNEADKLGDISSASIAKLFPQDFVQRIDQATQAIGKFGTDSKKIQREIDKTAQSFDNVTEEIAKYQKKYDELDKRRKNKNFLDSRTENLYRAQKKEYEKELKLDNNGKIKSLADESAAKQKALVDYENQKGFKDEASKRKSSTWRQLNKESEEAGRKVDDVKQKLQDVDEILDNTPTEFQVDKDFKKTAQLLSDLKTKASSLKAELDSLENIKTANLSQLETELSNLGIDVTQFNGDIEQMKQKLLEIKSEKIAEIRQELDKVPTIVNESSTEFKQLTTSINKSAQSMEVLEDRTRELDSLKSQIKDFFGLTNAVYLFREALMDAFETVQELDAAMTEMAVVTDYDIGDYWEQLPQYTERANELGLSIKDVYDSMTLFYQQGDGENLTFFREIVPEIC